MPEPKITRKEIVVVEIAEVNPQGYLEVTDKGGGFRKVSPKRESLFSLFEKDKAVEIGYAEYKDQEYVATARSVAEGVKEVIKEGASGTSPTPAPTPIIKPVPQKTPYKDDPDRQSSIENQVALKGAVELAVAGKIENNQILSYAEVFKRYLKGDITVKDEAVFASIITKHFKTEGG